MSSLFFGSILAYNALKYMMKKDVSNDVSKDVSNDVSNDVITTKRIITTSEIYSNIKIISVYKKDNVEIGTKIVDCYDNTIISVGSCESMYKYKVTYTTTLYDSVGKFVYIIYDPISGDIKQFKVENDVELLLEQCNSIISCLYLDPSCSQLQMIYDEKCTMCKYIMSKGVVKNYVQCFDVCTMKI